MSLIWLVVWLLNDRPTPEVWNIWMITLLMALVIDTSPNKRRRR